MVLWRRWHVTLSHGKFWVMDISGSQLLSVTWGTSLVSLRDSENGGQRSMWWGITSFNILDVKVKNMDLKYKLKPLVDFKEEHDVILFPFKYGPSASTLLTFWVRQFFVWGGLPSQSKRFSSSPGFYPADASKPTFPSYDNQKYFQKLPNVPWGTKSPPDANHW